ncbi:hypothetical protein [Microlunatus speluncae]|uniref:hypothetical protein n=1 Tax=Microlunatus speluncae TaxID=2594267 RepID=UPI00126608C9|nr:hypothetical protein [Microlunatus speluncae]
MAITVNRTQADDLADAERAIRAARKELHNWSAHCAAMLANPDEAPAIAMQARRSARIVEAHLDEAHVHTIAARMYDDGPALISEDR